MVYCTYLNFQEVEKQKLMLAEISSEKTKYEDLLRHTKSSLERQVTPEFSFLSSVIPFIASQSGHYCLEFPSLINSLFRQHLVVVLITQFQQRI